MSEAINLFERIDTLPEGVQEIINKYSENDAMTSKELDKFQDELWELGFMCKHIFNGESYQENDQGEIIETCQLCGDFKQESIVMKKPERKYEDKYYSFLSSIFGNNLSEDLDNVINKIYQDGYEDGVNSAIED